MKGGNSKRPIHAAAATCVREQPPNVKAFLGAFAAVAALVLIKVVVDDHDNLFVAAEAVHALGISVLIYKLSNEDTCAGFVGPSVLTSLESVSILPQLHVMQNTQIIEPFTAHYVFAVGVARFLSCAHWILQVLDTRGCLLTALGYGWWPSMVLLSEIVQTLNLADFCYYYAKGVLGCRCFSSDCYCSHF